MGRVKNTAIKTLGKRLIEQHPDRFTDVFEKNKQILNEIKKIKSKKIRNILAGYITRQMKKIKKAGI